MLFLRFAVVATAACIVLFPLVQATNPPSPQDVEDILDHVAESVARERPESSQGGGVAKRPRISDDTPGSSGAESSFDHLLPSINTQRRRDLLSHMDNFIEDNGLASIFSASSPTGEVLYAPSIFHATEQQKNAAFWIVVERYKYDYPNIRYLHSDIQDIKFVDGNIPSMVDIFTRRSVLKLPGYSAWDEGLGKQIFFDVGHYRVDLALLYADDAVHWMQMVAYPLQEANPKSLWLGTLSIPSIVVQQSNMIAQKARLAMESADRAGPGP